MSGRARLQCLIRWNSAIGKAAITNNGTANDRFCGAPCAARNGSAVAPFALLRRLHHFVSSSFDPRPFPAPSWRSHSLRLFVNDRRCSADDGFRGELGARFSSASAGSWRARASAIRARTRAATSGGNTSFKRAVGSFAGICASAHGASTRIAASCSAIRLMSLIRLISPRELFTEFVYVIGAGR